MAGGRVPVCPLQPRHVHGRLHLVIRLCITLCPMPGPTAWHAPPVLTTSTHSGSCSLPDFFRCAEYALMNSSALTSRSEDTWGRAPRPAENRSVAILLCKVRRAAGQGEGSEGGHALWVSVYCRVGCSSQCSSLCSWSVGSRAAPVHQERTPITDAAATLASAQPRAPTTTCCTMQAAGSNAAEMQPGRVPTHEPQLSRHMPTRRALQHPYRQLCNAIGGNTYQAHEWTLLALQACINAAAQLSVCA
jgi:hypothetical protein